MHVIAVISVRTRVRRDGVDADDAVDHRLDGDHLAAALTRKIQVVTAPPASAAARVGGRGGGLREGQSYCWCRPTDCSRHSGRRRQRRLHVAMKSHMQLEMQPVAQLADRRGAVR
jgi:hypothetical protein